MEKEMMTNGTDLIFKDQFLTNYKAADRAVATKTIPEDASESFVSDFTCIQKGLLAICEKKFDLITEILSSISTKSSFFQWKLLIKGMHSFYTCDDEKAYAHFHKLTPSLIPSKIARSFLLLINNTDQNYTPGRNYLGVLQTSCYLSGYSEYAEILPKAEILWLNRKYSESLELSFNKLSTIPVSSKTIEGHLSSFFFNVYFHLESEYKEHYFKALKCQNSKSHSKDLFDLFFTRIECIKSLYEENNPDEKIVSQWKSFIDKHRKIFGSDQFLEAEIFLMLGSVLDKSEQQLTTKSESSEYVYTRRPTIAEACYKTSINLTNNKWAYEALLQYYRKWNRTDDYWKLLKIAVMQFPTDKDVLYLAGKTALEQNLYALAIKHLEKAFRLDSIDTKLRQELIFAYIHAARSIPEGKYQAVRMRKTISKAMDLCSDTIDNFNCHKRYILLRKAALEFVTGDRLQGNADLDEGFKNSQNRTRILFFTYFIFRLYNVPVAFCKEIDLEVHKSLKSGMTQILLKDIFDTLHYFSSFKGINNFKTDIEVILKKAGKIFIPEDSCKELLGVYLKLILKFEFYHIAKNVVTLAIRSDPHNLLYKYCKLKCKITNYQSVSLAGLVKASDNLNGIIIDAQQSNDRETISIVREEIRNLDKYIKNMLNSFFPIKQDLLNADKNSIPFPNDFL